MMRLTGPQGTGRRLRPSRRLADRERGALSLFTAITMVGIFAVLTLVVDGGGKLQALSHAEATAQEAARTGAESLNIGQAIAGQGITIDPATAVTAARTYLREVGVTGTATYNQATDTLDVDVTAHYTPLFNFFGASTVTGQGSATLVYQAGG
jgi:Flp pilus assembly protein TadG